MMGNLSLEIGQEKKILSINHNVPIKMFLHHAIPLSIILPFDENTLFCNFIQLYKSESNRYLFDFYPYIGLGGVEINNYLQVHHLSHEMLNIQKREIVDFIIERINEDFYVLLELDATLIKNTLFSACDKPILHSIFIFGYDLSSESFKIFNFDKERNLTVIDMSFVDLVRSYFSDSTKTLLSSRPLLKNSSIKLLKIKNSDIKYNWSKQNIPKYIGNYICDYINAQDSEKCKHFKINKYEESNTTWGINIYNYFTRHLIGDYETNFALQNYCGLYEHKIIMHKRILYLIECGHINKVGLGESYLDVVKNASVLKSLFMKNSFSPNNKNVETMIGLIDEIKEKERNILYQVLQYLNK